MEQNILILWASPLFLFTEETRFGPKIEAFFLITFKSTAPNLSTDIETVAKEFFHTDPKRHNIQSARLTREKKDRIA